MNNPVNKASTYKIYVFLTALTTDRERYNSEAENNYTSYRFYVKYFHLAWRESIAIT